MAKPPTNLIRLDLIDPPADPHRELIDPGALGELADDMGANGLLQPIGVRGPSPEGRYEVVWGHRRYLAAKLLQWLSIEAKPHPWSWDGLDAMTAENGQRADLTPIEEARNVERMQKRGRPLAHIARVMRKSAGWVQARVNLLHYPQDVQDAVHARALPLVVAECLARVDHEEYRLSLIKEAARTGATGATAEAWVAHYASDRERIIGNRLMVDEIMSRRDAWVIFTACESCRKQVDYRETKSYRFCATCSADVDAAIRGEVPGSDAGAGGQQGAPSARG